MKEIIKMQKHPYYFKNLFLRAIKDWPRELDISQLTFYKSNDKYTVDGLWEICEEVCQIYYENNNEELIWLNLHDSIYIALFKLSEFCNKVELINLRQHKIKEIFDKRLQDILIDPESCNCSNKSIELIKEYFKANEDWQGNKMWTPPPEYYEDNNSAE